MNRRVSSYQRNAYVPRIGTRWIWEIDSPARALIEVVETKWNGEEWWVRTRTLLPRVERMPGQDEETNLNDLSRFWEACVPVLTKLTGRLNVFAVRAVADEPAPYQPCEHRHPEGDEVGVDEPAEKETQ